MFQATYRVNGQQKTSSGGHPQVRGLVVSSSGPTTFQGCRSVASEALGKPPNQLEIEGGAGCGDCARGINHVHRTTGELESPLTHAHIIRKEIKTREAPSVDLGRQQAVDVSMRLGQSSSRANPSQYKRTAQA